MKRTTRTNHGAEVPMPEPGELTILGAPVLGGRSWTEALMRGDFKWPLNLIAPRNKPSEGQATETGG